MTDLGTLGGSSAAAAAINDAGTVVGWAYLADEWTRHAFAWDAVGGTSDLRAAAGFDQSAASAIDASGHVAGWSYYAYYDPDYGYSESPPIATLFDGGAAVAIGDWYTAAHGIRDATADHGMQVVGYGYDACWSQVALLWEADAAGNVTRHELDDSLDAAFAGALVDANAVSVAGAAGRVVVSCAVNDVAHALVLTPSTLPPVPHPLPSPGYLSASA